MASLQIGCRVEVSGKGTQGTVAFIGNTSFASGKWIGVILDEPKGKNNGCVQGKSYFQCKENHGTFVRQSQLFLIDDEGNKIELLTAAEDVTPRSATNLRSKLSSSRQSLSGRSTATPSRSREDIRLPGSVPVVSSEVSLKRPSFVEPTSGWMSVKDTPKLSRSTTTPQQKSKSRIPTTMTKSLTFTPTIYEKSSTPEQTGFVETLKPQFTAGQPLISPNVQLQRSASFVDPVEHEGLKAQVHDLTEKLDTVKIKLKEKSHEIDSMKLKLDQAAEFKNKIMESQAALKRELERAKKEKEDAVLAQEDLSDINDALEMATLDKEMAEEKAEALQLELAESKEKIEELTLDLEILKAEFDKLGSTSLESDDNTSASNYQLKQLEQQNHRLRDTLVRMRDLSAHEKHEAQKLQKDLEEKKNENIELHKSNERLQARINELGTLVAELHEQVDAALGAEEMVEQLGLQKLSLEDKVKELEEAVADLEDLQDINDQLQEDSRELELQLREEVDLANSTAREFQRAKENALESLADRELTIVKFRELVQKLQEQCQDLQTQLQNESVNNDAMRTSIPEMLDFKKMFAETKAQARAIDLELRRLEVQQSQQHIQFLIAYMPDSFMARGGDNDALLTVILIKRLIWKCEILLSQVRDKFPAIELSKKGELVKGHRAEQFASRCRLSFHIYLLLSILQQFDYGLNTCSTDTLMKVAASYPEISQQERIIDSYIQLLKSDQLDENVNSEDLERSVTYFNTMHLLLLLSSGEGCLHHTKLLITYATAFICACDSIRTDIAIIQAVIKDDNEGDIPALCQHLSTVAEVTQQHLKQIKRRISLTPDAITLPIPDMANNLLKASQSTNKITKSLRDIAKTSFSKIALTTDEIYIEPDKLTELVNASCDKVFDASDGNDAIICLKNTMNHFANEIANISQAVQEVESYLPSTIITKQQDKEVATIILRAKKIKSELEQTKTLQEKLNSKENDIKELKLQLRAKQDEIGELTIRKDIAEKKLSNSSRDYDLTTEKLQRKLEEAQQLMKRKEKEYEETMDHLQADIDALENERGELKDKLKNYSKKVLIEGIAKSAAAAAAGGNLSGSSPSTPGGGTRESPLLLNEIRWLRKSLAAERDLRIKYEMAKGLKEIEEMKPLPVEIKEKWEQDDTLKRITNDVSNLIKDTQRTMSFVQVVDVSKRKPETRALANSPANYELNRRVKIEQLQKRFSQLQDEFVREVVKRKNAGRVESDFKDFPTSEMKKALEENNPVVVAELSLPCSKEILKCSKTIPLFVNLEQLNQIQNKLLITA